ncbi:hypothetical protein DRQ29_01820 [bacterium]|nr:MAG: hypothetical protein DRQ29_01820 [bacterium]
MDENREILDEIEKRSYEDKGKKKLNCVDALDIASKFGVKPILIGKLCNQHKIKFAKCQLGCFK